MKRILILLVAGLFILTPEFSQASTQGNETAVSLKEELGKGRKNKSGKYKKKKGFMWGLFKGKGQCDCPKH